MRGRVQRSDAHANKKERGTASVTHTTHSLRVVIPRTEQRRANLKASHRLPTLRIYLCIVGGNLLINCFTPPPPPNMHSMITSPECFDGNRNGGRVRSCCAEWRTLLLRKRVDITYCAYGKAPTRQLPSIPVGFSGSDRTRKQINEFESVIRYARKRALGVEFRSTSGFE